jgi:phospholipid/cholesterol/gamma-HCH transport system substrate-binding protein
MLGDQDIEGYVNKVKAGLGDIVTDISDSLSSKGTSNEFAKTFQALQHVLVNLDGITRQIHGSMSVYDRKMISVLSNVESITGTLAANNAQITSAIANLDSVAKDLNNAAIDETMSSARDAMRGLDSALDNADKSFTQLESLLAEINSGDGSLGKLVKDKELYDNFTETSRQLNLLLQDFRLNPKRYVNVSVFGKKQKQYDLPADDPAVND